MQLKEGVVVNDDARKGWGKGRLTSGQEIGG